MIKRILKILNTILLVFLAILLVFITNGTVEYSAVQKEIKDFKNRSELDFTVEAINTTFYKVAPKHEYEDLSRTVLTYSYHLNYIGSAGDIIITNRNPVKDVPVLNLPVSYFAKYFYVGHSTLSAINPKITYESVVNQDYDNGVRKVVNDWLYLDFDTRHIVGLRVKDIDDNLALKVDEYCESKVGYPYNYTFAFNRYNSYYCTDLISRAYKEANVNINYDYLATTGNDLFLSENTYMIFYREVVIKDGKYHFNIYYLKEDENV